MKKITLFALLLVPFTGVFATTLEQLSEASRKSTSVVETLYGDQSVFSYRVKKVSDEVKVDVLTLFNDESFVVGFECDKHGDHLDCHEYGEMTVPLPMESALPLSTLTNGEKASFELISQRLRPQLQRYTVWGFVNEDDDHGSEDEVWVRFDFFKGEQARHFYVWCHEHGHESTKGGELDCHVETKAPFEPQYK